MCKQTGTAKLNQLVSYLGSGHIRRPASISEARVIAGKIVAEWLQNPRSRQMAVETTASSTNEIRRLIADQAQHSGDTQIACALVAELSHKIPAELADDPIMDTIQLLVQSTEISLETNQV